MVASYTVSTQHWETETAVVFSKRKQKWQVASINGTGYGNARAYPSWMPNRRYGMETVPASQQHMHFAIIHFAKH